ncbi:protein kinase [Brachybacterium sp. NBEC-018]|uniref:serine/threonine-protein kinase n=1 Tax=Brachybacterium sp. NBEC-018 TaxID=2996004 RepID=UPI00217569A0|nr:serine/threonine protein kinase [Brachybacterium sp. NBEC-018]UVY83365.1 protein kinase [Brachybacterium sp. NBEC-018]
MSDVIAGRIALVDPLARGASGSLWRAVDRRHGAICAAKVMRQRDGAEVLRFVREQAVGGAQGLGAHPHLLPPYTWAAEDDTIVLVMPLVHGGTLADAVREHGPLPVPLVAALLRQLLDALAAVHAAGWVHRDVKPANLLLDATGSGAPHLLLADFGIALHETDIRLTETGMVAGTPGFLPPEAMTGTGGAAQDVWAAAACALEALDPTPPRERPDPAGRAEQARRALDGAPTPGPALRWLLAAMLDPDPLRRPSAAEARDLLPSAPPAPSDRIVLEDRIPSLPDDAVGAGLPEVPLGGPTGMSTTLPGLHARISSAASVSTAASVPSPPSASALPSADPADDPTIPRGPRPGAGSPGTPALPGTPATEEITGDGAATRGRRGRLAGALLLSSAVCLAAAGTLGALALHGW